MRDHHAGRNLGNGPARKNRLVPGVVRPKAVIALEISGGEGFVDEAIVREASADDGASTLDPGEFIGNL